MPRLTLLRNKRLKNWSINIAMILLVYFGMQAWYGRDLPDQRAPQVAGASLDGQFLNLYEQINQGPVLLHFWATWCSVCRLEQGSIDSIAEDHQVIAVASNSGSVESLRQAVNQRGITVKVLPDPDGRIAAQYGIKGFPTSLIIGRNGEIAFSETGFSTETGLRLRLWWAGLD